MCPLSDPALCSSLQMFTPFPHRWVSAKTQPKCLRIGHSRAPEAGRWIPGWRCHFSPQRRALHRPETMPTTARRGDFSGKALPSGPRDPRFGHLSLGPPGEEKGPPVAPPRSEVAPQVAGGRRGSPRAFGAPPSRLSLLSPRALPAHPGVRAEAGRRRALPLIVRGGGGGGGGGGAAEPRQDVAEAVAAVQLGLALVRLMEPLRRRPRKPCARGDKRGKGRRLARRRVRDPRGTRALARAAARPRRRGLPSAPCSLRPAPPACRPSADGPARAERPSPPRATLPVRQPASHVAPAPCRCCHGDAGSRAAPAATEDA